MLWEYGVIDSPVVPLSLWQPQLYSTGPGVESMAWSSPPL